MAIEVAIISKNPKTLSRRKLLDEEGEKVNFLWMPAHKEVAGNYIADKEAKAALDDDLLSAEKYPSQDLINWIKTEDKKSRKTRWKNSENNMKK
jgi:hypothetical protein